MEQQAAETTSRYHSSLCEDDEDKCGEWAGTCKKTGHVAFMRSHCPKTCKARAHLHESAARCRSRPLPCLAPCSRPASSGEEARSN